MVEISGVICNYTGYKEPTGIKDSVALRRAKIRHALDWLVARYLNLDTLLITNNMLPLKLTESQCEDIAVFTAQLRGVLDPVETWQYLIEIGYLADND